MVFLCDFLFCSICYVNVIGIYLLINLHELSDKAQKQKRIKETVNKIDYLAIML